MAAPAPPHLPASERLRRAGIAAWSIIGILILIYIVIQLLLRIRIIFAPLVLALLIIYMLNPAVTRLERRGVNRMLGTVMAYIVILGGLTLAGFALTPLVADQVDSFAAQWPEFRANVIEFSDDVTAGINDRFGTELDTTQISCFLGAEGADAPTAAECDRITSSFRDQLREQADRITSFGLSVLEGLFVFVIAALVGLYLLIDLPHLQRDALNVVPESHRDEVADLASKIGRAVGGFFRGQLVVALIVGVLSAIGFWIIGLPFWFLIGAIAGFFNLIPLVGPFIGGAIGFLVGTITQDVKLGLAAVVVEVIVQQLDNHVISPNVMRRAVNLHPVTVMLSILAGGAVGGFWGVLLAVPSVAVAKLLLGHVWATRVLGAEVSPVGRVAPGQPPPSPAPDDEETEPGDQHEMDEEREPVPTRHETPPG